MRVLTVNGNKIAINENWHSDTIKVYIEMIIEGYLLKEKPIYKFNKKTQILEKIKTDLDYCI